MLTMQEIIDRLRDRKLRLVADACGLSYPQIWRISAKKVSMVRPETMEKLSAYLQGVSTHDKKS